MERQPMALASVLASALTRQRSPSAASTEPLPDPAWYAEARAIQRELVCDALDALIPPHYRRADAHRFDFAAGKPFVVLTGPVGCGKTTSAVDLFRRESLRQLRVGEFTYAAQFMAEAGALRFDYQGERLMIAKWTRYPLLLLDDLGADSQLHSTSGDSREFALSLLYLVLEQRGSRNKKTIITTNIAADDWPQKLGERIAARLHRHGVVYGMG